jgi:hypothetical protein
VNVLTVFDRTVIVDAKLGDVRDALADDLPSLATLLPDVKRIDALDATVDEARGVTHRRDRWVGGSRSPLLRTLMPEGAVSWTIASSWQRDPFVVTWELEPMTWPLRFGGRGKVTFEPCDRHRTRVVLAGELVTPEASLASALLVVSGPRLERILADMVEKNVVALFARSGSFVAARQSQPRLARTPEHGVARRSA